MPKSTGKKPANAAASEASSAQQQQPGNNRRPKPADDKFEQIQNKYKKRQSPTKGTPKKKQRTIQRSNKHRIYTDTTPDGRDVFIVMNKNGVDPAFTHPINNEMAKNPRFKASLAITEWYYHVSDDDPNEIMRKPYYNGRGELKHRLQCVYFHQHTGQTSPDKRKLWIENAVLPLLNDAGRPNNNLFNSINPEGEKFEYGGDLQELRAASDGSFVADYLTLDNTFSLLIQDVGTEPDGMSVEEIMQHDDLLQLYFGPNKIQLFKDLYNSRHPANVPVANETDADPYKNIPGFQGYEST